MKKNKYPSTNLNCFVRPVHRAKLVPHWLLRGGGKVTTGTYTETRTETEKGTNQLLISLFGEGGERGGR